MSKFGITGLWELFHWIRLHLSPGLALGSFVFPTGGGFMMAEWLGFNFLLFGNFVFIFFCQSGGVFHLIIFCFEFVCPVLTCVHVSDLF